MSSLCAVETFGSATLHAGAFMTRLVSQRGWLRPSGMGGICNVPMVVYQGGRFNIRHQGSNIAGVCSR